MGLSQSGQTSEAIDEPRVCKIPMALTHLSEQAAEMLAPAQAAWWDKPRCSDAGHQGGHLHPSGHPTACCICRDDGDGLPRVRQAPARNLNETSCPTCAQPNLRRANNNHMLCWACEQHFCFLCRTRLKRRGGGHHFSRETCPQHTAL